MFTTEIRQNDEGGFLLYVAYVPADGEPEENPRNEAVVKAICMHVCICMHLGMHTKKPGKSPKTLIYKGKNKIPFSCMHCMHQYMGFLPFSRILYKGMMHTMHTRPRTAPERWNQAETERKDVCIPGCIRMHTARPECIHGPDRVHGDAYPGAWNTRSTRPGTAPTAPVDYTTPLPGGLTFADMLAATRAAADTTGRPATLVDDEGEPVLTIESDIMVL